MKREELMKLILDEFNRYTIQQTLAICSCLDSCFTDLDFFVKHAPENGIYKYSLDEYELAQKLAKYGKKIKFSNETLCRADLHVYVAKKENGNYVIITQDYSRLKRETVDYMTNLILALDMAIACVDLSKFSLIETAIKLHFYPGI